MVKGMWRLGLIAFVLLVADVVMFSKNGILNAVQNTATQVSSTKAAIIANGIHTGPAIAIPSQARASFGTATLPPTGPTPAIINNEDIPNAGALSQAYNITPNGPTQITGYTDHQGLNVVAGDEISDPTTGVVIVSSVDNMSNLTQTVHTVPGTGLISIVGFSGSLIDLSSPTGTGTYNIATNTVSWN